MQTMLTPNEVTQLSERIAANADRLIMKREEKKRIAANPSGTRHSETRGRPARRFANPFVDQIGPATEYDRYPLFAMDIVEGIARLDWHDRKTGGAETTKPLSVKILMNMLASLEEVTTAAVMEFTGLGQRHALRYAKALELAIPRLTASRPQHLIDAMGDRDTIERCPVYLRRIDIEKTYWTLGGSTEGAASP